MRATKWFLSFFLVIAIHLSAQDNYPKSDFRSPLDIPLYISGTFGEPRNTHFHAGLDFKTQNIEGKNVYAIADGYISRIIVSGWNYGNALYVTHPNGYTSVYAHLSKFNKEIAAYVQKTQEENTRFEVDIDSIDATMFVFKKGEIIAYSGNTGGSQGPHLHFEIRDKNNVSINPFLFGFDIKVLDNIKPNIFGLVAYNLADDRFFSNSKELKPSASNGIYSLTETVKVNKQQIGFGVSTTDKSTDSPHNNGVYDIKMYQDGILMYHYQMNSLAFDEGKYVYSHCDYWRRKNLGQSVHKCYVEPGNKLGTYNYLNNNGYIFLNDFLPHDIKIEVADFHNNTSVLNFKVQLDETSTFFNKTEYSFREVLFQGRDYQFKSDELNLCIDEHVLFDDMYLNIKQQSHTALSDGFHIGDVKLPAFSWFDVSIKPKTYNPALKNKYVVVFKNYKNATKCVGGYYDEDKQCMLAETREFGYYYVSIDTTAPYISPINITNGKSMVGATKIQFRISDNLSGILAYDCFINGKWAILEVDGKNQLYTYYIDSKVQKGLNELILVVKDKRNNTKKVTYSFSY